MVEHKKERLTSTHEPAQGHHDAHEAPNAPYGREVQIHDEEAKHKDAEKAEQAKDETRTPPA